MKKKIKLIVPSFLTLIFCLLLIAGSTYAIFSSQDDASIEVKSGKVDLKATISNLEAFSAEAVDSLGANDLDAGIVPANKLGAGQYRYKALVGTNENTLYTFTTGGTASLNTTTGALSLNKIVAGDRVTMKLNLTNYSNVDIKYRVKVSLESGLELFNELVIKINGVKLYGVSKTGTWTYLEAGLNPKSLDIPIEVYLPITNENMNSRFTTNENGYGTKIKFVVEAVQGNAKTVDEVLSNSVEATKEVETPSAEQVVFDNDQLVTVTVPAGALDNTTTALSVQVEPQDTVGNITISSEQAALSYDVKVLVTKSTSTESEVYESTTNKVKVNMFVGTGLKGVKLYHTHNDVTTEITDFDYDEETGYIEFETLKFSEYTVLYNKDLVIETVVNNVSTITTYKATDDQGVYTREVEDQVTGDTTIETFIPDKDEDGEIIINNGEIQAHTYGARIGSTYYEDFEEALAAYKASEEESVTITVLKNSTLTKQAQTLASKPLTVDLNGFTIIQNGNRFVAMGDVAITNTSKNEGVLDNSTGDLGLCAYNQNESSNINVKNVTIRSGAIAVIALTENNNIRIEDSKIIGLSVDGIRTQCNNNPLYIKNSTVDGVNSGIYLGKAQGDTTMIANNDTTIINSSITGTIGMQIMLSLDLSIIGGKIEGNSFGISTNGSDSLESNISFDGSEVSANGIGAYIAGAKSTVIKDTSFYGKNTSGIEIRAGNVTISGNSVFKTDRESVSATFNDNGTTVNGAGLAIVQHNTNTTMNITISGGSFIGGAGLVLANTTNNTDNNVIYNITGGTFTGSVAGIINLDSRCVVETNSNIISANQPNSIAIKYNNVENTLFDLTANTYNYSLHVGE